MRRRVMLSLLCATSLSLLAMPRDAVAQDTAAAEAAATQWLAHVDAGRYGESWTIAATAFKQAVTQGKWQKSATPATNPPGAPAGDYVR